MTVDQDNIRKQKVLLDIYASLVIAHTKAGGRLLTSADLTKMTAFDLLTLLAPNGVRFTYSSSDKMYTDGGESIPMQGMDG